MVEKKILHEIKVIGMRVKDYLQYNPKMDENIIFLKICIPIVHRKSECLGENDQSSINSTFFRVLTFFK